MISLIVHILNCCITSSIVTDKLKLAIILIKKKKIKQTSKIVIKFFNFNLNKKVFENVQQYKWYANMISLNELKNNLETEDGLISN